jgi:superfamily II DNA helicase RecQ
MSRVKPTTLAAMSGVHGVGQAKLVQYGDDFLGVIRQYLDEAEA